ncbi:MAG: GTP-binding protein [Alphaproteobacteria bacterium]|nr:GTP-binding protein [Rhodospirillales bacterium]MCW9044801.1 GTP-binding protein [Alphaproteobacteria bacterium]
MTRDLAKEAAQAIPITVITGFLGSGKTTLLNHLLKHPEMSEAAVLINEYGDIALDHLLVREISEDIVVLNSGCVCCTVRGDLVDSLKDLFLKRVRGEVNEFTRVVIETTGLADPAPIIHTLMSDSFIGTRYRLDGIVTTVDGVNAMGQMDKQREAVKQAAVADRIVLTKGDIAPDINPLKQRLIELNPAAPFLEAMNGEIEPSKLFDAGLFKPGNKHPDVEGWLHTEAYKHDHSHDHHDHDEHRHDDGISSFCLILEKPVNWTAFTMALELLLATKGEDLLRVKGILNIEGQDMPVAIHGVQHVFHPPVALPDWPDEDRQSRIVFITRNLGQQAVEQILGAIL